MEIQLLEVRPTAASNHQSVLLQWLTGLGKSSELQAAGRRFTLSGHPVNAPPQAATTGELASLSPQPLPPCSRSLTPLSMLMCFSQIILLHGKPGLKFSPAWKKAIGGGRLVESYLGKGCKEKVRQKWGDGCTHSVRSKRNMVHRFLYWALIITLWRSFCFMILLVVSLSKAH